MGCENLDNMNLAKGSFCFNGEIDGLALFESAITVANGSLRTESWWDAQIYDATNRVVTLIGTDDSEITPAEVTEYTPKRGFKVQTSKGSNEYMLKFKDTECLRQTLFPLNGSEVYAMFFTTSNFIRAARGTTNLNSRAVKANLSVSAELVDGINLLIVKISFASDFEASYVEIAMEDNFTTDEITGLTGVYFDAVSSTTTVQTVLAYDCNRVALEGLVSANFVFYNLTTDPTKATAITGTAVATNNSYAVTIAAQTLGDVIACEIATPAAANLYVTGKAVTQTAAS